MTKNISFSVLGIDSNRFVLATCEYLENYLKIINFDNILSTGISNGIITSINDASISIIELIARVEKKLSLDINNLYVLINNDTIFLKRQIETINIKNAKYITENDKNDLMDKLYNESEASLDNKLKVLEVIPIRYKVDDRSYVIDPLEMDGKMLDLEADIVLASKSMIDDIYKTINKSSISISGISYFDVVIKDICIFREEKELGVLVLNISIDYTNIIIINKNNIVFSKRLNFGGNYLIKDIMYCLKVSYDVAKKIIEENLNVNFESDNFVTYFDTNNDKKNITYTKIYEILEARLEEIFLLIKDKILNEKENLFSYGIVLMGWVSNINFVKNFLEKIFGIKVRLSFIDDKKIKLAENLLSIEDIRSNLVFLSALEYFYSKKEILNIFAKKAKGITIFSKMKKQLERIL